MEHKRCDCRFCGSGKWYAHRMDYSKVKILKQVARLNEKYPWVKIQQDSALIKKDEEDFTIQTDAVHASRLVWFGLLERREHKRDGFVKITQKGRDFLKGNATVPSRIWVSKGEVRETEKPEITIDKVKGIVLDKEYWDHYVVIEDKFNNLTSYLK
jgi:hypothetical protein